MSYRNQYYPDFVVHPGRTVRECFEEEDITAEEFAERYGLPVENVKAVVSLKGRITQEISDGMDKWLGTHGLFYRLQEHYDEECRRIKFQSIPYQNRWTVVKKIGRKRVKK